jgi:tetratricopeptide (TPR) repeat protein
MKPRLFHPLLLALLFVCCFCLATVLQPMAASGNAAGNDSSVLKILLGDGRKVVAERLFRQADITFHSGFYPSIFDQALTNSRHMTAQEGSAAEEEHERQMAFLGQPKDWIERFGRHFMITEHTHLRTNQESEILPWLKLSAELDPQRIETYTVTAYWLRDLGKTAEAERVLREGLRENPGSYEILFELGRLYFQNHKDPQRARNVWELALRRWREAENSGKTPDSFVLDEIATNLATLEEQAGNLRQAILYLQVAQQVSPNPGAIEKQIQELRKRGG